MPRRPLCGICTYRVGRGCDIFCGHPRGKKKPDRQVDWLTMGCEYFRAVEIGSSKGLGMATQHYRPPLSFQSDVPRSSRVRPWSVPWYPLPGPRPRIARLRPAGPPEPVDGLAEVLGAEEHTATRRYSRTAGRRRVDGQNQPCIL